MTQPTPPPAAEARGLSKTWGRGMTAVTALDGLDLVVPAGAFVAVMGPSGSGKSSLLHLLAALVAADAGQALVAGHDLAAMSESERTRFRRRHLGIVFQAFNLVPVLSALENAALPLLLDGVAPAAARERARERLAEVGLDDRASHRPDQLSGGEQQRVALARALVTEPALVLADEPTGNLDSATGERVCDLLQDLHQRHQRSLVVVTHESTVACRAERVVVLRDGHLVADLAGQDLATPARLDQACREALTTAPVPA